MLTNKYKSLTLSILTALLVTSPITTEAAASLEEPGIQTDIAKSEVQADIIKEDKTQKVSSQQTFPIGKINLTSEAIKLKDYTELLSKYENREVSMAELDKLSQIITQDLRSGGYPAALIYVPNQKFDRGGELTLTVSAGYYGKINIDNQSELSQKIVEGYFAGLKTGNIIKGIELESAMHKLTSVGGINAAGILSAGTKKGTTDLTIKIRKGKTATEMLYVENYGTTTAGRYRYGLQGNVELPKTAGTFNYAIVFSNGGQHNYNLGYSQHIGRSATKLGLNISRGDYELGAFRSIGAKGKAFTVGINGTTPIYNSWKDSLNIDYGYTYRNLDDEFENAGVDKKKHTHSVYAGINGLTRRGKAVFDYNLTQTLGTLGFDNDDANEYYKASDTEGTYNKTSFGASYLQTFDRYFDMKVKFSGQLAYNNLDGSEEITLGGINGVRAYPTGVGSGDEGYLGSLEMRYHTDVPGLTLSTYLDVGHVKITHDSSNALYGGETAKGWGIGVSYTKPGDYFARLDYARRIGGLSYYKDDKDANDNGRLWFMAGKVF